MSHTLSPELELHFGRESDWASRFFRDGVGVGAPSHKFSNPRVTVPQIIRTTYPWKQQSINIFQWFTVKFPNISMTIRSTPIQVLDIDITSKRASIMQLNTGIAPNVKLATVFPDEFSSRHFFDFSSISSHFPDSCQNPTFSCYPCFSHK